MTNKPWWIIFVEEIFKQSQIKSVLDIWAWKWTLSELCANLWAKVDAIEPNTLHEKFKFNEEILKNLSITYYEQKIEDFDFENKKYDLIVCVNVIMFLDKDYVLNKLLPSISNHLNKNWLFLIYFLNNIEDWKYPKYNYKFTQENIINAVNINVKEKHINKGNQFDTNRILFQKI